MKLPLVYALHSGKLYGTERMALAAVEGLADEFDPILFAPQGEALEEAQRLGFAVQPFASPIEFAWKLRPFLICHKRFVFIATGVKHSLACLAWNKLYRRQVVHLHMVHTCPEESFGLAVIEAMAANLPVLVPDSGGAGTLVEEGVSGFHFAANQSAARAAHLFKLRNAPADLLNRVVAGAWQVLGSRFSATARTADYRRLLHGGKL